MLNAESPVGKCPRECLPQHIWGIKAMDAIHQLLWIALRHFANDRDPALNRPPAHDQPGQSEGQRIAGSALHPGEVKQSLESVQRSNGRLVVMAAAVAGCKVRNSDGRW